MNEKKADPVPFIVHEADMARMERTVKRLWIVCCAMAAAVLINIGVLLMLICK